MAGGRGNTQYHGAYVRGLMRPATKRRKYRSMAGVRLGNKTAGFGEYLGDAG
ncbi:hypothetical protein DFR37_10690 [Eoetvoesiella caeni]|uniref:Uncharacterized protein n=1 Tax=Eoetvoesiella caeni TaxID=645616 RepID=A0A366H956_9BURK|nr:hypothetical protein DFR37_10690 [Eoetvoesiella caeni]